MDDEANAAMNISVCMALYNGEAFLRAQVDSILDQLKSEDELVVSDDGSTDGSLQILQSYQDPRIKILSPKKFGSPAQNFQYVLGSAKGEIIFLADQDDVWHNKKIEVFLDYLQNVDLAICDCRLVDAQLNEIESSFFDLNRSRTGLLKNLFKSSFIGCCMGFRKGVLEKALPFPKNVSMHDQWIGLIAQKYFRVKFIPQVLVDHRRHSKNYSTTGTRSKNSLNEKIFSRLQLIKNLSQY